jgi:Flp pilus assembly pilin Flp
MTRGSGVAAIKYGLIVAACSVAIITIVHGIGAVL